MSAASASSEMHSSRWIYMILCFSDCSRARKGASEAGGGEGADQHRPKESKGGAGAQDLQSRCREIHQPCHNVRRHTHTLIYCLSNHTLPSASALSSNTSIGVVVTYVKTMYARIFISLYTLHTFLLSLLLVDSETG